MLGHFGGPPRFNVSGYEVRYPGGVQPFGVKDVAAINETDACECVARNRLSERPTDCFGLIAERVK